MTYPGAADNQTISRILSDHPDLNAQTAGASRECRQRWPG
jgi:hypothetical protein